MCGIAGIIHRTNRKVEEASMLKMLDCIRHRGPDGQGMYFYNNLALGHRRLSIIDVSEAGAEPMHWNDILTITFNGEIYNYIELREELKKQGYQFFTDSDTEVLLASYNFWGEDCVSHFNGMWSFAILDKRKNKLFCSRDRFGIKPFYYYFDENVFVFSSEIKQILEIKPIKKVNEKILLDFLATNMTEHTHETFFNNIYKLPGSHSLVYDLQENTFRISKYYELKYHEEYSKLTIEDSIELFKTEFARSVKWRLRSDVKVGTCLSGGLDSSYISAVASGQYRKESNEKFTAITAEAVEEKENEIKYAQQVVSHLDLDWHVTTPTITDFNSALDQVIYTQEEPFKTTSVYMQYFVMKEAHKAKVKVLLDGQGSDEILLGYIRYIASQLSSLNTMKKIQGILNANRKYGVSVNEIIRHYLYFSNFYVRKFRIKTRTSLLKSKFRESIDFSVIKQLSQSQHDVFALQNMEIFRTQIPTLLNWEDKNSMAFSVETRLPFLDYQLVETCLSINNNYKIVDGWSKYLLRKNMEPVLPESITWRRKKIGFNAPVNKWLPDQAMILKEINDSELIRSLYSGPIQKLADRNIEWRLYNIAKWQKLFNIDNL